MADPTTAQHREMLDLVRATHAHIDSLMVAGIEEKVIVPAMLTALAERYLRASNSAPATAEWLQRHADMLMAHGPAMLEDIRRRYG